MLNDEAADPSISPAEAKALLGALRETARRQEAAAHELSTLTMQLQAAHAETLGELQSLIRLLEKAEGEERRTLRRRIKGRLPALVKEIWLIGQKVSPRKQVMHCQIWLENGQRRYAYILPASPPAGVALWASRASTCGTGWT